MLKKWAPWARQLQVICDTFHWVFVLCFRGVDYQHTEILVQAKLLNLVDQSLFVCLNDVKVLHSRGRYTIEFIEQIFLFLSFKHIGIF